MIPLNQPNKSLKPIIYEQIIQARRLRPVDGRGRPIRFGKKAKIAKLYDSKSWIVPVVGNDFSLTENAGFQSKIFPVKSDLPGLNENIRDWDKVTEVVNERHYGRKVLDILTDNGTSEALLREIALKNMQKQDEEFASETMRVGSGDAVTNVVAEDYLPILTHCYVIVTTTYTIEIKEPKTEIVKTREVFRSLLYRLEINKEEAFDIMSSIGDPTRYAALPDFKLKLVYVSNGINDSKDLIEEVPDLALRGVVTRRHPAQISIGENAGLKKGDLVSIFSQRMDKNGNMYSKRISRARVCKAWDDHAQINFGQHGRKP